MGFKVYDNLGREQVAPLASPPGAWEFIEKKTASAQANLDFDLPAGFNVYKVVLRAVTPATDGAVLFLRESDDGGATFEADAADYRWLWEGGSGSGTTASQAQGTDDSDSEIEMTGVTGNQSQEGTHGTLYVYNARSSTLRTRYSWDVLYVDNGTSVVKLTGLGNSLVTAVNDAIRFLYSAGNITSGEFVIYGLRETTAPGSDGAPQAFRSTQVFTASGTWNRPAGITKVYVEVIGAGGGGGGAAATAGGQAAAGTGGGAGGYATGLVDVGSISTSTITIGTAGTAGAAGNNNGGAGGNSSWADGTNTLTGNGGAGGLGSIATTQSGQVGVLGGTASGGDVNREGDASMHSVIQATVGMGGPGASSKYGAGGISSATAGQVTGAAGLGNGSGGAGGANGASQTAVAGGAGTAGIIVVWEFA